eukprot:scaffold1421_cov293-Prasinococcus_capsulatus_cf.AAC.1
METAHWALEMALVLLFDKPQLPSGVQGGVLTPSVAGQMPLVKRLQATGVRFDVHDSGKGDAA